MIIVDTSALIDSLTGPKRSAPQLRDLIEEGHRLLIPTVVLYEWLRGPRQTDELAAQEAIFPTEQALEFGIEEAKSASHIYTEVSRPRGRELDIAIAAHAVVRNASLWTLNPRDFADLPGLTLIAN